nr:hypothetical protein [Desulfobacterales bacterium]
MIQKALEKTGNRQTRAANILWHKRKGVAG